MSLPFPYLGCFKLTCLSNKAQNKSLKAVSYVNLCSSGLMAFFSVSLKTGDFMYRPYESCKTFAKSPWVNAVWWCCPRDLVSEPTVWCVYWPSSWACRCGSGPRPGRIYVGVSGLSLWLPSYFHQCWSTGGRHVPGMSCTEITKDHKALFCHLINSPITETAVDGDQHSSDIFYRQ